LQGSLIIHLHKREGENYGRSRYQSKDATMSSVTRYDQFNTINYVGILIEGNLMEDGDHGKKDDDLNLSDFSTFFFP